MSISILNPILVYPFLLLVAPKCLCVHQLCQGYHDSYSTIISIAYLCNQYNNVTPRALECKYSTGFHLHIPFIHPLCTLKPKNHISCLELHHIECKIQNLLEKWWITIYISSDCGKLPFWVRFILYLVILLWDSESPWKMMNNNIYSRQQNPFNVLILCEEQFIYHWINLGKMWKFEVRCSYILFLFVGNDIQIREHNYIICTSTSLKGFCCPRFESK